MTKYRPTRSKPVRGGGILIVASLLLLSLQGVLAEKEPTPFVYQEVDRVGQNLGPAEQHVCYGNGKVGFAFRISNTGWLRFLVIDDLGIPFSYDYPASASDGTCVFDAQGRFHGVYYRDFKYVHVATFDGTWTDERIAAAGAVFAPEAARSAGGSYFSVGYNPGNTSLAHAPYRIFRLNPETDQWDVLNSNFPHFGTSQYSLDVDSRGRIHILWDKSSYEPGGRDPDRYRQYSILENGTWTTVDAPYGNQDNWGWSMALGPDDQPYFAWTDDSQRPHLYAPLGPGGAYVDERFMQGGLFNEASGYDISVEVGSDGTPHLHHRFRSGDSNSPVGSFFFYTTKEDGAWKSTPLMPGVIQYGGDLTLDDCDQPVIGVSHSSTPYATPNIALLDQQVRIIGSTVLARPLDGHLCART